MRLGRDTNSLVNAVYGDSRSPAPTVGMGVTVLHWTDRSAGTVARVSPSGKTLWYRGDHAVVVSGSTFDGSASYRYDPLPDAPLLAARLTPKGWKTVGGPRISLGHRDAYHDPSF